MMKPTKRRWLAGVIAAAATMSQPLPWERGPRRARLARGLKARMAAGG
ncbi:MAG: hypothetical protein AAFR47_15980 [Pseudomonadota bacterium]